MSKKIKVFLISIGAILALFMILFFYVNLRIDNIIKDEIRSKLGSDYRFDFEKSAVDYIGKEFTLKGFSLIRSGKNADEWKIKVKEIQLYNFHPIRLLMEKRISLDSIVIENPVLKILNISELNLSKPEVPFDGNIGENPINMDFEALIINNAELVYNPEGPELLTAKIHLNTRDLTFSSLQNETYVIWKKTALSLKDISYTFPDSIFNLKIKEIVHLEDESGVSAQEIELLSHLSGEEFTRLNNNNKFLYQASIPEVIISNPPNYPDSLLIIKSVDVRSPSIKLYKNYTYPDPDRHTELPQALLADAPFKLRIDSILIENIELEYEMVHENGNSSNLNLDRGNLRLKDVQNINLNEPAFQGMVEARFMEETSASAHLIYYYENNSSYSLKGEVSGTDFNFINPILEKAAGITLTKGQFERFEYNFNGNDTILDGYLDFYYSDLNVHVKDQKTEKDKKILNILSDIAGGLLFWKHNPAQNKFRRSDVHVNRDYQKIFVETIFQGIMQGLVKSVSKIDIEKLEESRRLKEVKRKSRKNRKTH